jgi:hypothetical protein
VHYDGSAWTQIRLAGDGLYGVWGSSGSNVFTVGDAGIVLRFTGGVWQPSACGTSANLRDVWGTKGSDVFVVGENATIVHYGP